MKKEWLWRMLSGVLVICMVFGMLPVGYAVDSTTTNAGLYEISGAGTAASSAQLAFEYGRFSWADLYNFLVNQKGWRAEESSVKFQYKYAQDAGDYTVFSSEDTDKNIEWRTPDSYYVKRASVSSFYPTTPTNEYYFKVKQYYKLNVTCLDSSGENSMGSIIVNAGGGAITPKYENEYHIFLSDHLSGDDTVSVTLPAYDAEKYTRTVTLNGAVQTVTNNMLNWSMESSCDLSISYEVQQPSAVTCKVAYDYNGGDGALTEQTVTVGGVYGEAAKAAPTRTGYTFTGWKYGDEIITENSEEKPRRIIHWWHSGHQ